MLKNIVLLSLLLLTACTSVRKSEVRYETPDHHTLSADVYLPKEKTAHKKPAVVVIHAGSWQRKSGDMVSLCEKLASQGFVAINISYRFAPEFHYPVQLNDVEAILPWIHANSDKYEIDEKNIFTWGYSAGGHLALLLGNKMPKSFRGIVAGGAPTYLPGYPKSPLITTLIGATFQENPEAWQKASPLTYVTAATPPTFLYHGVEDTIVDPQHTELMDKKMTENKVPHQIYRVPGMGHIGVYLFSGGAEDRGIQFMKALLQ